MSVSSVHKRISFNGTQKKNSHYIWFLNTGYWPDYKNKQEVIHHLDGYPLNDDLSNLQVMTSSEHTSLHKTGENNPQYGVRRKKKSVS